MYSEAEYLGKNMFRLSSQYKLVPSTHTSSIVELQDNEIEQKDFFGLLVNKQNNDSRMIDCQTALLLYALQTPNLLPTYIIHELDTSTIKDIKYLLSLSILELEVHTTTGETEYLSGAKALSRLDKKLSKHTVPLSSINLKAIDNAYTLLPLDHQSLASALYRFNHKPVSKTLHTKLYDAKSVKEFFKLNTKQETKEFYNDWLPLENKEGWIGFRNQNSFMHKNHKDTQTYKLYLSPDSLDIFQKIFFEVTQLLYKTNAFQFKIGDDAYGLQRADKWVAYFYDKESLYHAISLLEQNIGDIPAQEVPFSGKSDLDWLSWGRDPQQIQEETISWRWLVCTEVAHGIIEQSKMLSDNSDINNIWSHVASRLERENINPNTFEPIE